MAKSLIDLVRAELPDAIVESHAQHGDETIVVEPSRWKDVARLLQTSPKADMNLLVDLTAVDFPDRAPRFEVVAHFYSLQKGHRLRMKTRVGRPDGTRAEVETLSDLWASANWMERECWDLLGVRFKGHPDLRRILLYPEFEGHPLRKDYPAQKIQPLVPYLHRDDIHKLPPFGDDEGMPFGRQVHEFGAGSADDDPELFPPRS